MESDVVGRLATLDADGYPHAAPIWFHWDGEVVRMTSRRNKPHLARLRQDASAGLVVDIESEERSDGQRPNRQVRIVGDVVLYENENGLWTRAITLRYFRGGDAERQALTRSAQQRVVIELRPSTIVAAASR